MKLILKIADSLETKKVQEFFKKHLSEDTSGITNLEYLCPFGISANIKRGQLIVLKNNSEIVGALRFYPRKSDNIVSVYQFSLREDLRGKGLIKTILRKTGYNNFETNCFLDDSFNNYYKKTGWKILKSDNKFNYWRIKFLK